MKYTSNRFSVFTGFLLSVLAVGIFVYADNPSVTVTSTVLPAFESQPSAQSSGLPINVLGIPTGNGATASPQPDINLNRCGPSMVLGFGQVVYDQTDMMIEGRDEVTNLVIARRHLSRRDQTKTVRNVLLSSGSLANNTTYQWVDVGDNTIDVSTISDAGLPPYTVGATFTTNATGTLTPNWNTGTATATVQLADVSVDKHSPFGPAWAFNYSHTITRYGDDVIMDSYGRRDRFTPAPLAYVTAEESSTSGTVKKTVTVTHQPVASEKWIVQLNGKTLTYTVPSSGTPTKTAVAQGLSNLINSESNYSTTITSSNEFFTVTYTSQNGDDFDLTIMAENGNVWEGTVGRFGRLTYTTTSPPTNYTGKYVLRMPHGTILEFGADNNALGKPAHLITIKSPNTSNTLGFTYETSGNLLERKLLSITDTFGSGRSITFTYGGDSDYLQGVSKITDFSNREILYDYDSSGRLLSMRSPTVAATGLVGLSDSFTSGKTYKYEYLNSTSSVLSNLLSAVIFPNQVADNSNTARYRWTYDEATQGAGNSSNQYFGYVKSFTLGAGKFSYTYRPLASFVGADSNKPLREIKVTDRMGTETVYKTNRIGQVLLEEVKSRGLRSDLTGSFAKLFKYNDDGQLIEGVDSLGSLTQYFYANRRDNKALTGNIDYPKAGNPRNMEFSMTDMILLPDTKRNADQQRIHTKVVYEPIYNKPFQSIDPRGLTGTASRAAFTTTTFYDYMEALDTNKTDLANLLGVSSAELTNLLPTGLVQTGDINGDSLINQKSGNIVKIKYPTVTLPSQSQLSALGISANGEETFRYNTLGKLIRHQDAESNVTTYSYYNNYGSADASDPGSSNGGGYLHQIIRDAEAVAGRNNSEGTPAALAQTTTYKYIQQAVQLEDTAGNTIFPENRRGIPTVMIDPRGVETNYYINELDQVVNEVRAATAPNSLTALAYELRKRYDANNNEFETQVENEDTLTDVEGSGNSDTSVDNWITTTTTFDILDQPISIVEDSGNLAIKTEYAYDLNQNMITESRGNASNNNRDEYTQTNMSYDERDLVISLTVGAGETEEATFGWSVDANGNVIAYVDGEDADANDSSDGFVGGDPFKTKYDGFNRPREMIDRMGNRTVYTYDNASNVISVKSYGKLNSADSEKLLSQVDTNYDERNRAIEVNRALIHYDNTIGQINEADSAPSDGFATKATLYDNLNREIAILDEEQGLTQKYYNAVYKPVTEIYADGSYTSFEYDANNNVTKITETEVNSTDSSLTSTFVTNKEYDALNRVIKIAEPNGQLANNGEFTEYRYDSRDNNIIYIDTKSNQVEMTYDGVGRLVQTDTFLSSTGEGASRISNTSNASPLSPQNPNPDGKITMQYEWDALHRKISETNDNGAIVLSEYDDLDRIVKNTYEDSSTEEWTYNDDGDIITYKDRNGTKISNVYDANSNKVAEIFVQDTISNLARSGTTERRWTYDGLNQVASAFNNNNPSTTADDVTCFYVRDSLGRVIKETQRIGSSTSTTSDLSIETQWEGASDDRKIGLTYPNGRKIKRTFDDDDRLVQVDEIENGSVELIASYTYEGPNKTIGTSYGNGATLTKTFDTRNRLTETNWKKGNSTIVNYVNTYDSNNNILSEDRRHLGSGNYDEHTYDSTNRAIEYKQDATISTNNNTVTVTGGTTSTRTLDGEGMMTEFSDEGVPNTLTVDDVDGDGIKENKLNRYTKFSNKTRSHDRNGNLDDKNTGVNDDNDPEYIQNYKNFIVEVRNGNSTTPIVEYVYDADWRVVLRKADNQTTRYLYDGLQIVEERKLSDDSVQRQYVTGSGTSEYIQMRVYSESEGELPEDYYYHYNNNDSVGAITSSEGSVIEYYEYSWFGKTKVIEGFGTSETYDEYVRNLYVD